MDAPKPPSLKPFGLMDAMIKFRDSVAPNLRIVPPTEPSPVEKVRQRVRAMPRPEGALACPECGSRSRVKVDCGAVVKNGRTIPGTVISQNECAECFKRDKHVQMRSGDERPEAVT